MRRRRFHPWALGAAAALALAQLAPRAGAQPSAPRMREVSEAWGLVHRHHRGASGLFYMPETMGSGVAILDYDGDGDEDVFFVDSGAMPGYEGEPARSVLYRNEGGRRFRDVTDAAGIRVAGYGMGAAAADVEGDGDVDLYVTAFGEDQLFVNRGDGTFVDGTVASGLGNPLWGSSAAFADADEDGDLDLYVTNYVDFSYEKNPTCGRKDLGQRSYCHPDVYDGLPDRYYRNEGAGRFVDATAAAGLAEEGGKGLGAAFSDLDGDGRQDLYVANDMTPNFLYHNRGGGRFVEVGMVTGSALSDEGLPEAGMGVELADLDGNGHPDVFVTNLDLQSNAFYRNQGSMLFADGRFYARIVDPSWLKVGFGVAAGDFDQDADLDLVVANGHIVHDIELLGTGSTYKQANQLMMNEGRGVFREHSAAGMDVVRSSRGLALGDLDADGDLDVVITNNDDLAEVYENVTPQPGGWVAIELQGAPPNTAAVGARLELAAGGVTQVREVRTATSYQSQSALAAHFGLGGAAAAERLAVRWPSGGPQGGRQVLLRPPPGHRLRLVSPPLTAPEPPR